MIHLSSLASIFEESGFVTPNASINSVSVESSTLLSVLDACGIPQQDSQVFEPSQCPILHLPAVYLVAHVSPVLYERRLTCFTRCKACCGCSVLVVLRFFVGVFAWFGLVSLFCCFVACLRSFTFHLQQFFPI